MKENDFNLFLNTTSIDLLSLPYKSSITSLGTIIVSHDKSLSILLAKASFAFLLISMLFYWFQTTFKYDKKTLIGNIPHLTMWCANLTLALLLFVRWFESGHFPLSNLYESLIFLSWSLTTIHLVLEDLLKKRKESTFSLTSGAITSPVALFTNAFATFSLPQEMQKVTVLVPALQSNWLMMHVSVMIISYAALLSGSLLAVAFLAIKFMDNKQKSEMSIAKQSFASYPLGSKKLMDSINNKSSTLVKTTPIELDSFWKSSILPQETNSVPSSTSLFEKDLLQILDNVSYRAIGLGFALLTIGILSGAVWANEAWGSYWSWDPKETWAFFTWLIFALYLHMRLSKGWVGKESAFVASFGFAVIWFCYLGVNLFGKGLHSYGWFH